MRDSVLNQRVVNAVFISERESIMCVSMPINFKSDFLLFVVVHVFHKSELQVTPISRGFLVKE